MRCNDMPPFSSSVGERKIMNHFVVTSYLEVTRRSLLVLNFVCFASFVVKFDFLFRLQHNSARPLLQKFTGGENFLRYLTRFPCNYEEDELGEGP